MEGGIVHSWKSFSAKQANRILGRIGPFWMRDYFDRYVRGEEHFMAAMEYIEQNPVKAGLVRSANDWRWGSASGKDAGGTPAFPGRSKMRAGRPRSQDAPTMRTGRLRSQGIPVQKISHKRIS